MKATKENRPVGPVRMMDNLIQPHNLLKQEFASVITRPHGIYKDIVLDVLAVLSAFCVGFLYKAYLGGSVPFLALLTGLLVFSICGILTVFFVQGFWHRMFIVFLEIVGLLAFFYRTPTQVLIAAGIAALLFFFWGQIEAAREIKNSVKIHFFKITFAYASKLATALVLMAIFLYFPQWTQDNIFLAKPSYAKLYDWSTNLASRFYPGVDFHASFKDLALEAIRSQAAQNSLFNGLPPAQQDETLRQSLDRLTSEIRDRFSIDVQPQDNASDVIYNIISDILKKWHEEYGSIFLVGWALAIFFIVRSIGSIFIWIVAGFAFLVYELLIVLNVTRVMSVSVSQEIVEFS